MRSRSVFIQKVIRVIQSIPPGKVVSYGQVAAYVGVPRAARQVGWVLGHLDSDVSLPWWRVVNNQGRISIAGNCYSDKNLQKKLLEQEGVVVTDNYILDIKAYRYKAEDTLLAQWQLPKTYREQILEKYGFI